MLRKHHHIIKHTARASLLVQIITAIIDLYILTLNIPKPYLILKQLLILEVIVQIVEGTFYVWLATSFQTIENITPYRYFDWFITTPTMLITLTIYLIYLNDYENDKKKDKNDIDIDKNDDFFKILKNNSTTITYIIILNAIMLTFGLLNEFNILNKYVAVFCGFIPFTILFYLIYDNYAKYSVQGTTLFIYFCGIWSIYGFAALMSYHWKNTFYNILDLFAKNFFGLYLAYIIWIASK
jgi:hypothetical protein